MKVEGVLHIKYQDIYIGKTKLKDEDTIESFKVKELKQIIQDARDKLIWNKKTRR